MMQSQYQAGVRLSFGFSRSRRGTLIQDSMRLMMLCDNFSHSGKYPQLPASHYCWIYYLCTDEPLVRGSLLESRQRPPAQGNPERKRISERTANPKGKHLRMDRHPERKRISERTAIPKGNASQKGLPPRKESISERTATPKGKHLRGSKEL